MTAPRLAWLLCGAALLLAALGLVLLVLNHTAPEGVVFDRWLEQVALALAFPTVGALIAANRPRNPIGWILVAAGISGAMVLFASEYALYALFTEPGALPGGRVAAWVSSWAGTVAFGVIFTYLFLLFPDGRLPSARWRPVAWAAAVALTVVTITAALKPRLTDEAGEPVPHGAPMTIENPVGLDGAGAVLHQIETTAIVLFVLVCVLPAVASLILRYRGSSGERRQQIKWLAYAAGMLAVGIFVVPDALRALWGETAAVSAVTDALEVVPVIGIPLAAGIAILRHRLYDIDVVIRRTLVYAVLTATLGATYLGLVLLVGLAVGESGLAVAVSTLAVAALFRPALGRIQAVVDRRFYRRRYDAALTLEAFGARLRDELDLEALGEDLRDVVSDTVQPAHVSLWLRSPR
jgi:hypothetical protein